MKNDRNVKLPPVSRAQADVKPDEITDAERLIEAQSTLRLAYAIANNAIYTGESDEYIAALYGICDAIVEDDDDWQTRHGTEFITDINDVEL